MRIPFDMNRSSMIFELNKPFKKLQVHCRCKTHGFDCI